MQVELANTDKIEIEFELSAEINADELCGKINRSADEVCSILMNTRDNAKRRQTLLELSGQICNALAETETERGTFKFASWILTRARFQFPEKLS